MKLHSYANPRLETLVKNKCKETNVKPYKLIQIAVEEYCDPKTKTPDQTALQKAIVFSKKAIVYLESLP